jgi:hypothetical protein
MDLAQTLNHAGCILYERGQYVDAYDAFCGAHQALWYSANGRTIRQLDDQRRAMVVMDPAIQRAYDRIGMSGIFCKSSTTTTTHHHHQQQQQQQHRPEDNLRDCARKGVSESDDSETTVLKPIMMMIPVDDAADDSLYVSMPFHWPESQVWQCHEQFVTNMAIVWNNKGLVLQRQRNLHRSLTCYALARSWMCRIATTALSHDRPHHMDGPSPFVRRLELSRVIEDSTNRILSELGR